MPREVVFGQELRGLGAGDVAHGVIVIVKVLGNDGTDWIALRTSQELNLSDRIGALTMALDIAREEARDSWAEGRDEEPS